MLIKRAVKLHLVLTVTSLLVLGSLLFTQAAQAAQPEPLPDTSRSKKMAISLPG